jgi:hypothetical protein
MTATQTSITPLRKAKPTSADLNPGRSTAPTIDYDLVPPAGLVQLSSRHPRMKRSDHEFTARRNARYQDESRVRKAHKRISVFTGKKVKDPVSILPLHLSDFEKKMLIEASSPEVLAKLGYDARKILTPREDRDFFAALAREFLVGILRDRLKGQK